VNLLVDVNMSPRRAAYLRDAGNYAVHWTAIGAPNAPDQEIARYAAEAGFIILTRDLDFGAIPAASRAARPSVIQFRGPRQFPSQIGPRVVLLLNQLADELAAGAFVTMDLHKTRFRLLPLRPQ
jgi:predicted nuclease of predicted toxin-antitoxin system